MKFTHKNIPKHKKYFCILNSISKKYTTKTSNNTISSHLDWKINHVVNPLYFKINLFLVKPIGNHVVLVSRALCSPPPNIICSLSLVVFISILLRHYLESHNIHHYLSFCEYNLGLYEGEKYAYQYEQDVDELNEDTH